ncbi:MAG: tetratricopeptide repeat protein [Planctomycetes bacterium]|nr:tetratricopeptide repeat protein [Planctomycetota bacterium]
MKKGLILLVIVILGWGLAVQGATIKLKDGSELQGDIIEKGKTVVKIRIEGGLELEIDGEKIASVDGQAYTVDKRAAYEEQLRALDDTKAEAQYELGKWCRERGMRAEAEQHLKKAIEIDPMHEGANLALGRVFIEKEGKWMDRYEAQKKGYKLGRKSGKWVTANEAMAERGMKEYKGYMLSDAEIKAMKAREIRRYKNLYYTHAVCDLKNDILHIDFYNKCKLDKKQEEEFFKVIAEAESKRQFFRDQIHAINDRVEVAYNRLKEEGMKGVYNTYERPEGVEAAAGSAEYEVIDIKKGFTEQMWPYAERAMKMLAEMKGPRSQKGTALFAMDHNYCMCCHSDMHANTECESCHRGGREIQAHPRELSALKEIRAMSGKEWAQKKEKIIRQWCRPIKNAAQLSKMELKRRQMMERESIETLFTETRDQDATAFERNKEAMAAKLACSDASERVRIEAKVLGARRHELSHNVKARDRIVNCFFDGTLFTYLSGKLGKKAKTLLAAEGKGAGLVEKQTVITGKAAFEQYCGFCHPIERVMVRIRMGMGPAMWAKAATKRLRYWKGDWTEEEMQQRIDAIVDYICELESKQSNKKGKKEEF